MLISALLLTHSSGVSNDLEELAEWLRAFNKELIGGSTIEDYLAASWAPSEVYNKGQGKVHPVVAQGRAWIAEPPPGVHSLVATILVEKELGITTTSRIEYFVRRLVASKSSKKPKPLLVRRELKLKFILTEIALELQLEPRLVSGLARLLSSAEEANLSLADEESPFKLPSSPAKSSVKQSLAVRTDEIKRLEALLQRERASRAAEVLALTRQVKAHQKKETKRMKAREERKQKKAEARTRKKAQRQQARQEALKVAEESMATEISSRRLAKSQRSAHKAVETLGESKKKVKDLKIEVRDLEETLDRANAHIKELLDEFGALSKEHETAKGLLDQIKHFKLRGRYVP